MAAYEDLLQYDIPSSLIENAPKTNVGIVNTAPDQFFSPRDPRIKNYLNYDVNTELNPWDPSSKFWPYEPDYAGIMSLNAYQQAGNPVSIEELGMAQGQYNPMTQKFAIDPRTLNPANQKFDEPRNTIFHEGKHYFIDKYGKLVPTTAALSPRDEHAAIFFADMWNKHLNYKKNKSMILDRKQAKAFMEMHNLGKKWVNNPTTFTGGLEPGINTLRRLVTDPEDDLGDTFDQRLAQYQSYRDLNRGSYTRPTMTQREMVKEADLTGGTVNPFEATRAKYNRGGIASLVV